MHMRETVLYLFQVWNMTSSSVVFLEPISCSTDRQADSQTEVHTRDAWY